jgi:predicted MFS family arabinose efflux permease
MSARLYPRATLAVLTALNFLNYIDRSILFAVQPLIQREFHIGDLQAGYLTTAFFFCYMLAAPVLGWLADHFARRPIIVAGALVWSAATLLTAFTRDYQMLLVRHTVVGIGEASFVAAAPSMIADLFPERKRGRALSVFFMAIPTGTALGYVLGAWLGAVHGWRTPFYVAAGPGVLLALLLLTLPEPLRGAHDSAPATPERRSLAGLARNRAFLSATLGMAMMTFALGGMQVWMPTFLVRVRGLKLLEANLFFALSTVVNGVVATLSGGWVADRLLRRRGDAYYLVSGIAMLVSVPLALAAIYVRGPAVFPLIFVATFALLFNTGPLNAAVVDSVGAQIRASALALNVLVIHLLGDALSPSVMGYISDRTQSLQLAFLAGVAAIVLSAAILLYGRRFAPQMRALGAAWIE